MPFIQIIPPDEATGLLKAIYSGAMNRAGYVAGIIQMMSRDPESCRASMRFYVSLMKRPNALSAARREMLATVVSNINDCYY